MVIKDDVYRQFKTGDISITIGRLFREKGKGSGIGGTKLPSCRACGRNIKDSETYVKMEWGFKRGLLYFHSGCWSSMSRDIDK